MNSLQVRKSSISLITLLGAVFFTQAQEQRKSYNERFNVNEDVTVEINTNYTDVVLETWNRDEVVIEAEIVIEDISAEEAAGVFKNWNFNAVGNSDKVTVSTNSPMSWSQADNVVILGDKDFNFDYHFAGPEVIVPPMPEVVVPPVPPIAFNFGDLNFDYEAYKKDGEKYLKEWKEKFKENFDEDFKEDMKAWKKEYEIQMKEHEHELEEMQKDRERMHAEREKMHKDQAAMREEQRQIVEEARRAAKEAKKAAVIGYRVAEAEAPNVFFYRDGNQKINENLKIKRTIRIKAPKGAKLKMNVRHGEVKLAENFKNINANLSYTSLYAVTVDGENSVIKANYSPITVDSWNKGELTVNYVKKVDLKQVKSVKLLSKSSNVIIGTITGDAIINGSFGDLKINAMGADFHSLDINLDNSDAQLTLPSNASFTFYCSASDSNVKLPAYMKFEVSEMYNNRLIKGFNKQKNSHKTVNLVADLSDVTIR